MADEAIITHPFLNKGIEARIFQQTILNTCINKNTLVVLPTGTGKTIISIMHIAYILQRGDLNNDRFILILAPTKPLVNQHVKSLRTFLKIPREKIVELSGSVSPLQRKQMVQKTWIIVATPQTVRNDIIHNQLNLLKCILIYFDEAHRASGDYDYVYIADILHQINVHARIVALTASPGTDKEDILKICKNLFIEKVESRDKDDPELKRYLPEVEVERTEVPLPIEFEEVLEKIISIGEREVANLRGKNLTEKTFNFLYKSELLRLKNELAKNFRANYLDLMTCNRLIYILILKEAIESQGIPSAYLLIQTWKERNSKTIKGLLQSEEFTFITERITQLNKIGVVHPKLLQLYEILEKEDLTNSRIIIFCNLRSTCQVVSKALSEKRFYSRAFVGQAGRKGLTQKNQITILEAFRKNQFPILVSTSVLEEGLDVDECNLVIFYDGTNSAIRKIQRAGRTGRKKNGRIIILTTHHTNDTVAHYISTAKEKKMHQLLSNINWLNEELETPIEPQVKAFTPIKSEENKFDFEESIQMNENNFDNIKNKSDGRSKNENTDEEKSPFVKALDDAIKWENEKKLKTQEHSPLMDNENTLKNSSGLKKEVEQKIKIYVDSREKNSKILFYLMKEGIQLDFKQLECGDYILSDRVAIEYKKGEDLLSSIIDGRLFEQLGSISNAYQIPILIIEGFPSGGIHPEAIAGALASFMIDFGVSIIQTQSSEETATILKRIAIREQKIKKRQTIIRKGFHISDPKTNLIHIISAFPGINRTLATRLLDKFGSIRAIMNSTEEDLATVDGLGPIKSKKISELINEQYKTENSIE